MGYTTFKQFIQWCAEGTKKNAETNIPSLITLANLVRQHIHMLYSEVQMAVDKEACFRVQCFPLDCNDCRETYFGITLPGDMEGIEAAWRNTTVVPMFSKWREAVIGIGKSDSCRLQIIDQGNLFPTELEPNWREPCRLMVRCERPEDRGKEFRIKYLNQDDEIVEDAIKLSQEFATTTDAVKQIVRPAGIVLPDTRKGKITLSKEVKREPISIYSPNESHVPAYKRVRLTGVCETDTILVKATAKYSPLYFMEDVAEFDNELAIREFAKMFVYRDNDDPTRGFAAMAKLAEDTGKTYLLGQQAREKGAAIQQAFFSGRDVNRSGLKGRRRRR